MTRTIVGVVAGLLALAPQPAAGPGAAPREETKTLWAGKVRTDRAILLEKTVKGTPAEIFRLWTTLEGVRTFFAPDARLDPRVGGRYEIIFDPATDPEGRSRGTRGARILTFTEPRARAFEWTAPPLAAELNENPGRPALDTGGQTMEMPKPQEEHRKLQALAGNWVGEETIYPSPWDPKGGTATARVQSRLDLDGFFLITDYVEERGGRASYRGHGVFGWDPEEKCYTMHWFDSTGGVAPAPARGRWEGNRLSFEQRTPMGHSRYTYDLDGEGRYALRIENSQDGKQWTPFMEARYTRK